MDPPSSQLTSEPSQETEPGSQEERTGEEDGMAEEKENPFSSPREVYGRLIEIVNNESLVEEMLPFEETVMDCILEQMRYMSEGLQKIGSKLGTFVVEQHQIEIGRFRFLVNQYYRTRLNKLERKANEFVRLLRSNPEKAFHLLSPLEIKYLDNYVTSIDTYLDEVVLSQMPANINNFRLGNIPENPTSGEDEYVFVKCADSTSVTIDDPLAGQEIVHMNEEEQYFLPFSSIRPHFEKGSAILHIM